jgi:hypothetical protein
MSTSQQITGPEDRFKRIFDPAVRKFEETTKTSLRNHPFAKELEGCDTPDAVSKLFRTKAEVFSEFCEGDKIVIAILDPVIHILLNFSDVVVEGIGLRVVSPFICSA